MNTLAAVAPQGTCGWQSATFTDDLARSSTEVTPAGLDGGTATSMTFLAKLTGFDASPAVTTPSHVRRRRRGEDVGRRAVDDLDGQARNWRRS